MPSSLLKRKREQMVNIIQLDLYKERRAAARKFNRKAKPRTADNFMKAQAFEKLT